MKMKFYTNTAPEVTPSPELIFELEDTQDNNSVYLKASRRGTERWYYILAISKNGIELPYAVSESLNLPLDTRGRIKIAE